MKELKDNINKIYRYYGYGQDLTTRELKKDLNKKIDVLELFKELHTKEINIIQTELGKEPFEALKD